MVPESVLSNVVQAREMTGVVHNVWRARHTFQAALAECTAGAVWVAPQQEALQPLRQHWVDGMRQVWSRVTTLPLFSKREVFLFLWEVLGQGRAQQVGSSAARRLVGHAGWTLRLRWPKLNAPRPPPHRYLYPVLQTDSAYLRAPCKFESYVDDPRNLGNLTSIQRICEQSK
jgi:hypothetical protein